MSTFPTALYLAVGDLVTLSGGDYVPASGDYVNLLDVTNFLALQGGLSIKPLPKIHEERTAGAVTRMRAARAMQTRVLEVHLLVRGAGTDATSVQKHWAQIEHKLAQARAASGPMGHGTGVCLLVRWATNNASTALGPNFTAYDVLTGEMEPEDQLINPAAGYGAILHLQVLPYGRLTAQTYPGVGTYTGTISATSASLYLGTATSGPIAGTQGALAQIHLLDVSTAGAINRVRVGLRSYQGPSGGMASSDFQPVLNCAALGSATLSTGQTNAVNSDFATLSMNDTIPTWHDVAKATSPNGVLQQNGIYDVWVRVRDHSNTAQTLTNVVFTTPAGSTPMPPDTYTVVLLGTNSGSPLGVAAPTTPQTITVSYPNTPNIFQDGFETGDDSNFDTIAVTSNQGTGSIEVTTASALAGSYGCRIRGNMYFPQLAMSNSNVYTPFALQLLKPFSVPDTNPLYVSAWMQFNGGPTGSSYVFLCAIGSSALQYTNQFLTGGSTPQSLNSNGWMGGFLCAIAFHDNTFYLVTWHSGSPNFTVMGSAASLINVPVWVTLSISVTTLASATTYSATGTIVSGSHSVTATDGVCSVGIAPSGVTNWHADQAFWGMYVPPLSSPFGGASADIFVDDCMVYTATSEIMRPNYDLHFTFTDPNPSPGGAYVYVQQGDRGYKGVAVSLPSGSTIAAPWYGSAAATPFSYETQPVSLRARVNTAGWSIGTPQVTPAVQTVLQQSQWHMVLLGTMALPPVSKFEGLNPASGTGSGDFGYEIDVQAEPGYAGTAVSIDVDAIWLLPSDEPQIVATIPGLGNTTKTEWVIDTRRDGRTGAVLRDAATKTNVLTPVLTQGHMVLANGNQMLVFIVERENGVHDVQNTAYQVQVRYQPLTDWPYDDPTTY